MAYGKWDCFYVDAAAVQKHVAGLRARGMGHRRIEALSGLTRAALQALPNVTRVSRRTEAIILAIPLPACVFDPILADGAQISVIGSQRRIQALARMGWSAEMLAARVGCDRRRLAALTSGQQTKVTVRWARRIDELFNELQDVPGPGRKAARFAELKGWAPPIAWDDDTIDDPNAKPQHDAHRFVSFAEKYEELRDHCLVTGLDAITERLNRDDPASVKRQIERYLEQERKVAS